MTAVGSRTVGVGHAGRGGSCDSRYLSWVEFRNWGWVECGIAGVRWGVGGSYTGEMLVGSPRCPRWLQGGVGCHGVPGVVWAGREHQEHHGAGWGWPVPCNNYTVPLCQLVGFRPLSTEDRESARLPTQEGKRKMRNEWGCESWFPHMEQGL